MSLVRRAVLPIAVLCVVPGILVGGPPVRMGFRVNLTAMNASAVLYEPAWVRVETEWIGHYDGEPNSYGSLDFGPQQECASGPDSPELQRAYLRWLGRTHKEESEGKRGEVRVRDYLVPLRYDNYFLSKPGVYQLVLGCPDAWKTYDKPEVRSQPPWSNTILFRVSEPAGEDKAALEWAGGPGPLGDLMGLGKLVQGGRKKWNSVHENADPKVPYSRIKRFVAAEKTFVSLFSKAVYTPYALLHLIRLAKHGSTASRIQLDPKTHNRWFVSDWEGVKSWSELFLSRYPSHPLADEAAYLHAWAVYELGGRDAALEELTDFEGTYPSSPHLPFAKKTAAALLADPAAAPKWEYYTKWTADESGAPLIY